MAGIQPQHIAIVMDGNGRWAAKRGMPRVEGHRAGVDAVKGVIRCCLSYKIPVLSLFAFSSENWQRPQEEVNFLMEIFLEALRGEVAELSAQGVQLCFSGDRNFLRPELQQQMDEAEQQTAINGQLLLNIMVNYGGKWDITEACRKLATKVRNGQLEPEAITESMLAEHLSNARMFDPDLFIRTSGEYRLSNFYLWQTAYTELYFTEVLWPDFDEVEFKKAIDNFHNRERRFGLLHENTGTQQDQICSDSEL